MISELTKLESNVPAPEARKKQDDVQESTDSDPTSELGAAVDPKPRESHDSSTDKDRTTGTAKLKTVLKIRFLGSFPSKRTSLEATF